VVKLRVAPALRSSGSAGGPDFQVAPNLRSSVVSDDWICGQAPREDRGRGLSLATTCSRFLSAASETHRSNATRRREQRQESVAHFDRGSHGPACAASQAGWFVACRPRPDRGIATPSRSVVASRNQPPPSGGRPDLPLPGPVGCGPSASRWSNHDARKERRSTRGISRRLPGGRPFMPRRRAGPRPSPASLDEPRVASTRVIEESAAGTNSRATARRSRCAPVRDATDPPSANGGVLAQTAPE